MKPSAPDQTVTQNLSKLGVHTKLGHGFSSVCESQIRISFRIWVWLEIRAWHKVRMSRNQGLSETASCFLPDDLSGTTPWSPYSCIYTRSTLSDVLVSEVSSQVGESVAGRWDSSHSTSWRGECGNVGIPAVKKEDCVEKLVLSSFDFLITLIEVCCSA